MKNKTSVGTWIGFVLILVWCLLPVAWIISLSFKSVEETAAGSPQFLPEDPTLQNYRDILDNPDFTDALRNSFGIAIISTFLAVILATLAAYAIARLEFKGKRLVLSLALAIAMFPVVSLVGPLFDMWRTFGLFNTWPGLIIPYMSFTLPLAIWTLSAFFREIPWEMEQAAQVDGATSWQAFRKVIVPLAAPGVFTAAILTFFFAWNEFVLAHLAHVHDHVARTVPGPDGLLRRARSVQPAVRAAGHRLGGGHRPDHHHRPVVPAKDRRRPHLRRSEGLSPWLPST